MSALKAYIAKDDENAVIVFGKRNDWALRESAASDLFHGDATAIESVKRVPHYDSYAEAGRVPPLVLIRDGWWFECAGCCKRVDEDAEDEYGEPLEPCSHDSHPGSVWCSADCRDSDLQERADRIATEKRETEETTAALLKKFPGCTVYWIGRRDYSKPESLEATFTFPGCTSTYTRVRWRPSEPGITLVPRSLLNEWFLYEAGRMNAQDRDPGDEHSPSRVT